MLHKTILQRIGEDCIGHIYLNFSAPPRGQLRFLGLLMLLKWVATLPPTCPPPMGEGSAPSHSVGGVGITNHLLHFVQLSEMASSSIRGLGQQCRV